MSLEKSIQHGKDWRRSYRGSAVFDTSCRPGGRCKYCINARKFAGIKASNGYSIKEQVDDLTEQGQLDEGGRILGLH